MGKETLSLHFILMTICFNKSVPFPELHGEFTEYVGRAEDAIIAISNYRLHIKFKESVVNVPLQLIENSECRDMFQLHVTCKDCKVVRCQFSTFEQCQEWLKRLNAVVRPPSRLEDLFSFAFHAWCMEVYAGEKEQHGELCRPGEHVTSWFKNEVERMCFDTQNAWRISDINSKLCPSYPQQLLVPAWITDKELENVAAFRSWKRFPAVVYRLTTGAVIARCGQPEVSWWGWRNADDEHLVQSIAKACAVDSSSRKHLSNGSYTNGNDLPDTDFESSMTNSSEVETLATQPHKLLILDARSYAAAVANRAKGGGCECPEYYPNCEVVFMGMANIHSIRKSFQSLRFLCTQMPDPANWLSALESTKWLQHLSLLLKAALLVVNAVDRDHRPVLVHCSDGWDRTPQIVALSKLLLDPYYRTVEGFQVLVETDWLDFGHKFADRCGHGENSEDLNERCPVFLQWLDCVHQLQRQFPCSFEFNEAFLVKLVQHTYSCLFGTFLCNSGKEREDRHVQERTCSVWSLLRPANRTLRNMLYSTHSETVLHPVCHVRNLMLWTAVYLPSSSPTTPSDDSCAPYPVPGCNPEDAPLGRRTKTRSFDNLPSACELGSSLAPNRRSSDPSLNEKWQDHRRSLELNMAVGPEGVGNQDQEVRPNGVGPYPDGVDSELEDSPQPQGSHAELGQEASVSTAETGAEAEKAELSVAVGVAEGQMENILKEATKEEAGADVQREGSAAVTHVITTVDTEVSLASCNSLILHPRGSCSQHRWCHTLLGRAAISPEQPSRSHLDDDGLTLHTDAIQQRLRQIEAGHQMEVETLKKQVQELWSRLENQQHAGSHRINGDMGDEVTSMTDSEYNLDANCLSRCSTELFSEASWEQVDKQDTEVTRWYPDHLAAQCYGCESRFWLATRRHHCRNCGNVFCASCCDQKIPVPSQQLFEPSRVCKTCYGSLKLSPAPLDLDLELEKPIAASSN
uniref:phosphatidylinositol-3,5-bisphosphate 3-phosphatase n=1 Tax=Sander lucioperca TaxID=283035 RepID=A0A8C9YQV0_SANLU